MAELALGFLRQKTQQIRPFGAQICWAVVGIMSCTQGARLQMEGSTLAGGILMIFPNFIEIVIDI